MPNSNLIAIPSDAHIVRVFLPVKPRQRRFHSIIGLHDGTVNRAETL
jgi:hypothetical protein